MALIKALYFSLPEIMLKRLLEEELLIHIDKELLPAFSQLALSFQGDKNFAETALEVKQKLRKSAVKIGTTYGPSLQQAWMRSLLGEWVPHNYSESSKLLVFQQGQSLLITIKDWSAQGIPKELTTTLLDGILEGVLKTFHLDTPEIVEDKGAFTTWKVDL